MLRCSLRVPLALQFLMTASLFGVLASVVLVQTLVELVDLVERLWLGFGPF
jgi:hypothetical protein